MRPRRALLPGVGEDLAVGAADEHLPTTRIAKQLLTNVDQIRGRNHVNDIQCDTPTLLRQVKVRRLERVRLPTVVSEVSARTTSPAKTAARAAGSLVARWEGFAVEEPTHPALEEPWQKLKASWSDDAAHSALPRAGGDGRGARRRGGQYRRRKLAEPDDEKAERGLQRAVTMAQTLYVAKAKAERPPRAPVISKIVGTMFAGLHPAGGGLRRDRDLHRARPTTTLERESRRLRLRPHR